GSTTAAVEREMLLDNRGAERHAGNCSGVVKGMIRQAYYHAESFLHIHDRAQVVVRGRRRIRADAMQDGQFPASPIARGGDGFPDLIRIRHARGNDHRLAGTRDVFDQRQVYRLERVDLVSGCVQALQQIHCRFVERRAEDRDAGLAGALKQRSMPFPWHMRFGVEIVKRSSIPQAAMNAKILIIAVQRDRIRTIGLQLDRVSARLFGGMNDAGCGLDAAVVVRRHLGDHVGWATRSKQPSADTDRQCLVSGFHVSLPPKPLSRLQTEAEYRMVGSAIEKSVIQNAFFGKPQLAMESRGNLVESNRLATNLAQPDSCERVIQRRQTE